MLKTFKIFAFVSLILFGASYSFADSVNDILSPGDLIEGHIKLEGQCNECHKKFDKAAQNTLCKDCHKEIKNDIAEMRGFHGHQREQKPCKECHTEHKGRNAKIVIFSSFDFDHSQSDFKLKGGHLNDKVKCVDCHIPLKKYREAPSECVACHTKDDKHKGALGKKCADCHVEKDWKTTTFDHDKTDFKLLGKHFDVKCKECHIGEKYKDTPKLCNSCHKKDDKHKTKFGPKCETCHNEKSWKEINFNHSKQTKYPLLWKHIDVKCTSCHTGNLYKDKLQSNCFSCHKKDDKHKGTLGVKCESCHLEKGWKEILFDHAKRTKYPLIGKHLTTKCTSCHTVDYKVKLPMDCFSCHKKDDKHKGNFGKKCETCHVERDWKEILFDHTKLTKYPLLFKHKEVKCISCHKGDLYKDKLETKCISCHTKDDKHKGNFGKKCETCHIEKAWKEILFDHTKLTKYPLLFKHIEVKCTSCHKGDLYKDKLETKCYSCHEKDDKHKGQEGKKCETCHTEKSWKVEKFDHRITRFPLTGKHFQLECKKCHLSVAFKDSKPDCWSCHQKEDVHKRRLGTLCEDCHNNRDWKSWDFDHDKTSFKLDGKHKKLTCLECHKDPMDKKVTMKSACARCHDKDDKHDGAYGNQCDHCHVGLTWKEIKVGSKRWMNK